jgi:hypothetical protein
MTFGEMQLRRTSIGRRDWGVPLFSLSVVSTDIDAAQ